MGVIKKILFRGDILGRPRHRNLFLDMEENIHIHYRDLRIELGRGEFEDIATIFAKQSAELLGIIRDKDYQDGALPNANQDDVRIWTESKLKHDVKYHPQRFSLEDCGDGYHFHYRNLKLLIDKDEFRQIVRILGALDLDAPYAANYDEVVELLEANDIDFTYDIGNLPDNTLAILVARHHLPKVRDIFKYIGFSAENLDTGQKRFANEKLQVLVRVDTKHSVSDYRRYRGLNATQRLADFLPAKGQAIEPEELNLIKCQVLDLYYALKAGKACAAAQDPQAWLYSHANREVVFPYEAGARTSSAKSGAENLYRAWANLINGCQLGFIKPEKDVLPPAIQEDIRHQVEEKLRREVASYIAVNKVWIMGSSLRGALGVYRTPFVHGKLVKLGSDIDLLVEIAPDREDDTPGYWDLHLENASNHCAIYHVAQIPLADDKKLAAWSKRFPNIPFLQHLIDAYVYFPSRGHREEIDTFLKKFGARLFYERSRDGLIYRGDEEKTIALRLQELHGFGPTAVERLKVSTQNAIYKVVADGRDYILKLFKVSGNHGQERIAAHVGYEACLVNQLAERGIPTARVVPIPAGDARVFDGFPTLLFERIPGTVQQRPEYPLERICEALARLHRVQIDSPLELEQDFQFDDICMIWLPQFETLRMRIGYDEAIARAFEKLAVLAASCHPGVNRLKWFTGSIAVHNHGDVNPKNVLYQATGPVWFFDFNNAFFGPRMADIMDGAFEFSLAEKYIHLADFSRFDRFVALYSEHYPLTDAEGADLPHWIALAGIIKFAKEVKMMLEKPHESLRRKRALAIADFVLDRLDGADAHE